MTLLMRPFRLGMSLQPYRLGAALQVTDTGVTPPFDPGQIPPNQFLVQGPVSPGLVPVSGPVPCRAPGYMLPNGAVNNMMRLCNPDGSPFNVVDTLPVIASVPTSDGQTPVTNPGATAPAGQTVIVTPTSGSIPPPNTPLVAAPATNFLTDSLLGGIPNWVLLGAAALFLMGGKK